MWIKIFYITYFKEPEEPTEHLFDEKRKCNIDDEQDEDDYDLENCIRLYKFTDSKSIDIFFDHLFESLDGLFSNKSNYELIRHVSSLLKHFRICLFDRVFPIETVFLYEEKINSIIDLISSDVPYKIRFGAIRTASIIIDLNEKTAKMIFLRTNLIRYCHSSIQTGITRLTIIAFKILSDLLVLFPEHTETILSDLNPSVLYDMMNTPPNIDDEDSSTCQSRLYEEIFRISYYFGQQDSLAIEDVASLMLICSFGFLSDNLLQMKYPLKLIISFMSRKLIDYQIICEYTEVNFDQILSADYHEITTLAVKLIGLLVADPNFVEIPASILLNLLRLGQQDVIEEIGRTFVAMAENGRDDLRQQVISNESVCLMFAVIGQYIGDKQYLGKFAFSRAIAPALLSLFDTPEFLMQRLPDSLHVLLCIMRMDDKELMMKSIQLLSNLSLTVISDENKDYLVETLQMFGFDESCECAESCGDDDVIEALQNLQYILNL